MKCPNCGADIPAAATTCPDCHSSLSSDSQRDRVAIFHRLKASDAFANRETAERLARLPKVGAIQRAILIAFFAVFIGGSAFIGVAALGMAGVFGVIGARAGGGAGAAFSMVPLMFALFPLGFVVLGVVLFRATMTKMKKLETDPAQAIPVIVIDKRIHVWGGTGNSSAKTHYFVTCETQDGSRQEYQVWDGAMYGQMSSGDAGILFIRSNYGVDFDRVAM